MDFIALLCMPLFWSKDSILWFSLFRSSKIIKDYWYIAVFLCVGSNSQFSTVLTFWCASVGEWPHPCVHMCDGFFPTKSYHWSWADRSAGSLRNWRPGPWPCCRCRTARGPTDEPGPCLLTLGKSKSNISGSNG